MRTTDIKSGSKTLEAATDAMQAVLRGDVQLILSCTNTLLGMIQSGRMKALAAASAARAPPRPNVPTMIESGISGFEATSWFGVVVRAGTPQAIIDRLSAATLKSLQNPQVSASPQKIGVEPYPRDGKELEAFYRAEIARWARVVKESGSRASRCNRLRQRAAWEPARLESSRVISK